MREWLCSVILVGVVRLCKLLGYEVLVSIQRIEDIKKLTDQMQKWADTHRVFLPKDASIDVTKLDAGYVIQNTELRQYASLFPGIPRSVDFNTHVVMPNQIPTSIPDTASTWLSQAHKESTVQVQEGNKIDIPKPRKLLMKQLFYKVFLKKADK